MDQTRDLCLNNISDHEFEILMKYVDSRYVIGLDGNDFVYTDEFYNLLNNKINEEDMTFIQAYNSLGFSVDDLGEHRARNAMEKAKSFQDEKQRFQTSSEHD